MLLKAVLVFLSCHMPHATCHSFSVLVILNWSHCPTNERLFSQVAAPQEAMMDAMLIKHLSRLCRQQAEQMSANIAQFRHKKYVKRLVASMRGKADSPSYLSAN